MTFRTYGSFIGHASNNGNRGIQNLVSRYFYRLLGAFPTIQYIKATGGLVTTDVLGSDGELYVKHEFTTPGIFYAENGGNVEIYVESIAGGGSGGSAVPFGGYGGGGGGGSGSYSICTLNLNPNYSNYEIITGLGAATSPGAPAPGLTGGVSTFGIMVGNGQSPIIKITNGGGLGGGGGAPQGPGGAGGAGGTLSTSLDVTVVKSASVSGGTGTDYREDAPNGAGGGGGNVWPLPTTNQPTDLLYPVPSTTAGRGGPGGTGGGGSVGSNGFTRIYYKQAYYTQEIGLIASGGNIVTTPGNGYKYHTFTEPGYFYTFTPVNIEILMVGGGGGSGSWGGGGAGGLFHHPSWIISRDTYAVTVGDGGTGSVNGGSVATAGGPSIFEPVSTVKSFVATSVGGGAGSTGDGAGGSMGSVSGTPTGWGTWSPTDTALQPTQPQPGVPIGYNHYGFKCGNWAYYSAGGAGGAGEAGSDATATGYTNGTNTPSPGGDGRQYPEFAGPLIGLPELSPHNGYFAGGGGSGSGRDGWVNNAGTNQVGQGGLGGGGDGAAHTGSSAVNNHTAGSDYTGGGGGGASSFPGGYPGKNGGKGIVVIRYAVI